MQPVAVSAYYPFLLSLDSHGAPGQARALKHSTGTVSTGSKGRARNEQIEPMNTVPSGGARKLSRYGVRKVSTLRRLECGSPHGGLGAEGCSEGGDRQAVGHLEDHGRCGRGIGGPPKDERRPGPTSFTPHETRVRQLLAEPPDMPATVLARAGRVDRLEPLVPGQCQSDPG